MPPSSAYGTSPSEWGDAGAAAKSRAEAVMIASRRGQP
jgi:hypothetical protein